MKWMIRCDMEGISGVVSYNQVTPGNPEYAYGQKMLMNDLRAVIEGLRAQGDNEIWLYDMHYYGRNVILDELDAGVKVISGKPDYTPGNLGWLKDGFDGVILLGLHSMAANSGGLLAHNYELDVRSIKLNGLEVGEIGMEAAIAGDAGVPVLMVAGDSEGMREALDIMPHVATVTVKESMGPVMGLCYTPLKNASHLKAASSKCADGRITGIPFKINPPVELYMRFSQGGLLDKISIPLKRFQYSPDEFIIKGGSVVEVWEYYLKAK